MLYLEDYFEMIENLPMEMRDRFTEMREMDLQVQNAMDSLDGRVQTFFKKCQSTPAVKQEWKDEQFNKLKEEYNKALEDADEKVQLANQIYEMVERYLRKLDQEVLKFKMELEADNAGITEILERRSLEMDIQPAVNNHRAEKRKYAPALGNHNHIGDKRTSTEKVLSSLANEVARESIVGYRGGSTTAAGTVAGPGSSTPHQNPLSFTIGGPPGTTSNAAIAAAASKAIGATLEMQQGRRTSSLKASYEALARTPELSKDFAFSSGDYRSSGATSQPATPPEPKASRNKKSSSRSHQQQQAQLAVSAPVIPIIPEPVAVDVTIPAAGEEQAAAATWTYDPNEPRYCICNDVSYGEMVGCDNDDCPIEWFHYGCVGLTQAPKGKWYCPQCMVAMKRRGRK